MSTQKQIESRRRGSTPTRRRQAKRAAPAESDSTIVHYRDFPKELHLRIRAMAKERGMTATDMVVALIDVGMMGIAKPAKESQRAKGSE